MSEAEVVEEITKPLKWYIGKRSQSWASQFVKNYKNGSVKRSTVMKLFEDFGYRLSEPAKFSRL